VYIISTLTLLEDCHISPYCVSSIHKVFFLSYEDMAAVTDLLKCSLNGNVSRTFGTAVRDSLRRGGTARWGQSIRILRIKHSYLDSFFPGGCGKYPRCRMYDVLFFAVYGPLEQACRTRGATDYTPANDTFSELLVSHSTISFSTQTYFWFVESCPVVKQEATTIPSS